MSVNKYRPHLHLIPEDEANRQLILGFLGHEAVNETIVYVRAPAGGWHKVVEVFESEYVPLLRRRTNASLVMLIDFDGEANRRTVVEQRIPEDLKPRVFVIGSKEDPETLQRTLKMSRESIGRALADDCVAERLELWLHPHLEHNGAELDRLAQIVKPIVFR